MCRIEEKIYIGSDGRKRTFQDTFECDRARRRGKRCSKPEKKTREYIGAPPIARDDAPSPASNNPPTPTGGGSYVVEERRPSISGRRSSMRPGSSVKPEIIIQIGSKKDRDTKYPRTHVPKSYKRSSLGNSSTASNEIAVDSPGSDASYPIRTGLPETAVPQTPPFGQPQGYTTRHAVPQGHRHTLSASSVTTSQTPSLYTTSETEPESPLGRHAPEYPRTIVHNTRSNPSPPVTARGQTAPSSNYRTRPDAPHSSSQDTGSSRDNAGDYSDVVDMYASSNGSNASSSRAAAPEITDRAIDRERRRQRKESEKKLREEDEKEEERRLEERLSQAAEQAKKEVRFATLETGRYEERERLRKEQSERQKTEEREREHEKEREKERQRKRDSEKRTVKEAEKRATKRPEREKTQPPTREFHQKQPSGRRSRRNSMTQADIDKQAHLLLQEQVQMSRERTAAEQREREEAMQQRFATRPQPHATQPYHVEESRPTASGGRRRGSVVIDPPVLPPLTTSFPQQQSYSTRPPSSHTQPYTREQLPSARYSPSQLGNPFAQPPTRTSNSSMDNNPFAAPSTRPIHPSHPPVPVVHHYPPVASSNAWETQTIQTALPSYPSGQAAQYATQGHSRAQQATRNMAQAYQAHDEWRSG